MLWVQVKLGANNGTLAVLMMYGSGHGAWGRRDKAIVSAKHLGPMRH